MLITDYLIHDNPAFFSFYHRILACRARPYLLALREHSQLLSAVEHNDHVTTLTTEPELTWEEENHGTMITALQAMEYNATFYSLTPAVPISVLLSRRDHSTIQPTTSSLLMPTTRSVLLQVLGLVPLTCRPAAFHAARLLISAMLLSPRFLPATFSSMQTLACLSAAVARLTGVGAYSDILLERSTLRRCRTDIISLFVRMFGDHSMPGPHVEEYNSDPSLLSREQRIEYRHSSLYFRYSADRMYPAQNHLLVGVVDCWLLAIGAIFPRGHAELKISSGGPGARLTRYTLARASKLPVTAPNLYIPVLGLPFTSGRAIDSYTPRDALALPHTTSLAAFMNSRSYRKFVDSLSTERQRYVAQDDPVSIFSLRTIDAVLARIPILFSESQHLFTGLLSTASLPKRVRRRVMPNPVHWLDDALQTSARVIHPNPDFTLSTEKLHALLAEIKDLPNLTTDVEYWMRDDAPHVRAWDGNVAGGAAYCCYRYNLHKLLQNAAVSRKRMWLLLRAPSGHAVPQDTLTDLIVLCVAAALFSGVSARHLVARERWAVTQAEERRCVSVFSTEAQAKAAARLLNAAEAARFDDMYGTITVGTTKMYYDVALPLVFTARPAADVSDYIKTRSDRYGQPKPPRTLEYVADAALRNTVTADYASLWLGPLLASGFPLAYDGPGTVGPNLHVVDMMSKQLSERMLAEASGAVFLKQTDGLVPYRTLWRDAVGRWLRRDPSPWTSNYLWYGTRNRWVPLSLLNRGLPADAAAVADEFESDGESLRSAVSDSDASDLSLDSALSAESQYSSGDAASSDSDEDTEASDGDDDMSDAVSDASSAGGSIEVSEDEEEAEEDDEGEDADDEDDEDA